MELKKATLKAYNKLEINVKSKAAVIFGSGRSYLKKLMIETDESNLEFFEQAINAISKASKQSVEKSMKNNTSIQKLISEITNHINSKK